MHISFFNCFHGSPIQNLVHTNSFFRLVPFIFYNPVTEGYPAIHTVHTGCPKRYETFLNLNKCPTFNFGIPKCARIYKQYLKKLFQGIASIILCKSYAYGNVKDVSRNKSNATHIRTERGLNVIF